MQTEANSVWEFADRVGRVSQHRMWGSNRKAKILPDKI